MNKKYRKAIIAGNWKMNMLPSEVKGFIDELKAGLPLSRSCTVAICGPFVDLPALAQSTKKSRIQIGAEDVSTKHSGAYTGEVSVDMLKDCGCNFVIVGHSERRTYHNETDEIVREKAFVVLESGLTPIICVGESLEQREHGITMEFIASQVKNALYGMTPEQVQNTVIAYEPIWAIGTGKTATAEQAAQVCGHIRNTISDLYDRNVSRSVSILYGGSMNAGNAAGLLAKPDIDGGLIGGASLKPAEFLKIITAACNPAKAELD